MTDPDSIVAAIGSFIPFFTPMVMFARIELGDPALWEIFLGVGILVGTTILSTWAAARLYKAGVLMYGKGPSFASAMRMVGSTPESRKKGRTT